MFWYSCKRPASLLMTFAKLKQEACLKWKAEKLSIERSGYASIYVYLTFNKSSAFLLLLVPNYYTY